MTGPRDPATRYAVPVDYETGMELSERQLHHLEAISAAGEAIYEAMHFAEGSTPPGEHQQHDFRSRRMQHAADLLELALMLGRRAVLETP